MHVIDIAFANGYSLPYPGFALLHNRRECAENLRLIGGMRVSYARSLPHASKRGTPKSEIQRHGYRARIPDLPPLRCLPTAILGHKHRFPQVFFNRQADRSRLPLAPPD
jgi:hypothetical protein